MPRDWSRHLQPSPPPPSHELGRCSVFRVTRAPSFRALVLLMTLSGALCAVRLVQRLWWLLFDFQPLGFWWEAVLLLVQEGVGFLSGVLTILAAAGVILLYSRQRVGGGRLLYRVQRIRATLMLLSLLLVTALTALLLWGAAHYRMSVTVIAVVSAFGIAAVVVLGTTCRFYTNTARILADLNGSFRQGRFTMGGGVECLFRAQCTVLMAALCVPAALVLVEGAGIVWLLDFIKPVIGSTMTNELRAMLMRPVTGVYGMYGVECLQYLLSIAQLALAARLYGVYRRAHDG